MNRKPHRKIQIESKYRYHVFSELLPEFQPSDENGQRLHLILTKALQKSRHYLAAAMDDDPFIYFSQIEAKRLGGRYFRENFHILKERGLLKQIVKINHMNKSQLLLTFEPITLTPIWHNEEISHARINSSLKKYFKERKCDLSNVVSRYIVPNLRKVRFDIKEELFIHVVSSNYLSYVNDFQASNHSRIKKKPLPFDKYMETSMHLYIKMLDFNSAKGDEILEFVTQDQFSGRVHSPITVLPKYLKYCDIIKYNGESMTELDIKTFQPMLLAMILGDTDYSRWYHSVKDCYEALQERFSLPSRNSAKSYMYAFVFGTKFGKKHEQFCQHFPDAGKILTQWKTTYLADNPNSYKVTKQGKPKPNFHSNVSMLAQREEVKYMRMLWSLLGRNNIPFVTIHDAILVPASKADQAEKIIKYNLQKWFNGKAEIRRTELGKKMVKDVA